MPSRCANPSCNAVFGDLQQGRIFSLVFGPELSGSLLRDDKPPRRTQHFWLCDACARSMTVCRRENRAVVRRLPPGGERPAVAA